MLSSFLRHAVSHWSLKHSWTKTHGSDFSFSKISCEREYHSMDCCFASSIAYLSFLSFFCSQTAHQNDDSPFSIDLGLACHSFSCVFGHIETSYHVDFKGVLKLFIAGDFFNSTFSANKCLYVDHSCAVNNSIDFAKGSNGIFKECLHLILVRDICFEEVKLILFGRLLSLLFIGTNNHYLCSHGAEQLGGCQSKSRGPPSDDNYKILVNLHQQQQQTDKYLICASQSNIFIMSQTPLCKASVSIN